MLKVEEFIKAMVASQVENTANFFQSNLSPNDDLPYYQFEVPTPVESNEDALVVTLKVKTWGDSLRSKAVLSYIIGKIFRDNGVDYDYTFSVEDVQRV